MEKASQILSEARALEGKDPLKAAELYVSAVKLLKQAKAESGGGDAGRRIETLAAEASSKFEDC
eukprot:CAMPEP_0174924084 /NCGR_PEP_ID=MMETSP1355-20121228/7014_1 /TAXON_ID=464990 /ORGANISM="Hemiselmis tepida, Strain CCMP443" /LENGTH=63 /DNA_ID=CAMNT_0016169835 /DNA_START=135 /DNA_END=323 /DNA_ORIENTATION=-